jgi:hypothetical protein
MIGVPSMEDVPVGEVQPGEQDQLVADADSVQRGADAGLDLEQGFGRALERLVRSVRRRTQCRADDADSVDRVGLASRHSCESRSDELGRADPSEVTPVHTERERRA